MWVNKGACAQGGIVATQRLAKFRALLEAEVVDLKALQQASWSGIPHQCVQQSKAMMTRRQQADSQTIHALSTSRPTFLVHMASS